MIEVLSPTNKRPGEGREMYEAQRLAILRSRTHLVEIDLLPNLQFSPLTPGTQAVISQSF